MKKILSLTVLSALILSACSLTGTSEIQNTKITNADEALDNEIYQDAIESDSLERCDDIKAEIKAQECRDVINAFALTDEAVVNLDKSKCKEIALTRYVEECETQFEIAKSEAQSQEEALKQYKEDQTNNISAIQLNDPGSCEKITDEEGKYTCLYNIYVNEAIQKNDTEPCKEIGRADLIKICKDSVQNNTVTRTPVI